MDVQRDHSNNIVALNIAKEMAGEIFRQNSPRDEQIEEGVLENMEEVQRDASFRTRNRKNSRNPDSVCSDTSCESKDSVASFTGNADNCQQFVELNSRFHSGVPPMPQFYNRGPPYFIYNGQMYSALPYYSYQSQQPYPMYASVDEQCQNVPFYQASHNQAGYGQTTDMQLPRETTRESENGDPTNGEDTGEDGKQEIATGESQQMNLNISIPPEGMFPNQQVYGSGDFNDRNQINVSPRSEDNEEGATNFIPTQIYYNQRLCASQIPYPQPPNLHEQQQDYRYPPIDYHGYHEHVVNTFHQQVADKARFQYPAIYISTTGLITVLMKHDVSVEMTVEQAVRLVSHQQKLVGAINSRGNASFLYHPAAHVRQDLTTTETDLFLGRKVKMITDYISFANNFKCYKFDYDSIDESTPDFADLSKDQSVNFLFTENQSNPDILNQCTDIVSKAQYESDPKRKGICIRINGFKIVQTSKGDVVVNGKHKFLRMSPTTSVLRLETNFVQIDVEMNWNVRIKRGAHSINASHLGIVVSNGKVEAAFDENHRVHACLLPSRRPLLIGGNSTRAQSDDDERNEAADRKRR